MTDGVGIPADSARDAASLSVLHLIDPDAVGQRAVSSLRLLIRERMNLRRDALIAVGANAGRLDPFARIGAPLGRADLAWPALRSLLGRWRRFDVVHAWSWRTATLAAAASPDTPRVVSLFDPPNARDLHAGAWIRACGVALRRRSVVKRRPAVAIFDGEPLAALWGSERRRWASGAVVPLPREAFKPGVRIDAAALRTAWGAHPDDFVVAIVGEPPEALDLHRALFAVGMAGVSGRSFFAVAPREGARADRIAWLSRRLRPHWRLALQPGGIRDVLHACDAALWLAGVTGAAGEVAPESIVEAMAAGLPVVAEDTPGSRIICPDEACIRTPPGHRDGVAAALARLYDDRPFARRLGNAALSAVSSRSSIAKWSDSIDRLERFAAGAAPPLTAGGRVIASVRS